ncbi:hypothetical protein [[Eubacterium] cellulosolvens]
MAIVQIEVGGGVMAVVGMVVVEIGAVGMMVVDRDRKDEENLEVEIP